MKIAYNWLKEFLEFDLEIEKISELLTDLGLEVEGIKKIESIKGSLKGIVVGKVLTCEQHPNADKLKVTTVAIGTKEPIQIVCGASNVSQGQNVAVATVGAVLYNENEDSFTIKKSKIRGEVSNGMICAEDELGLGKSHDGIIVLATNLKPGTPLAEVYKIETDFVFEIGLTPNRADAMSHYGVARDLCAGLLQKDIKTIVITPSVSDFYVEERTNRIEIEVTNTTLIPRYAGVTISNIKVKDSPNWLQNKLKIIGLTPINNIVDITNYVMHSIGQPLHAFDISKIAGAKIVVKTLPNKTKITTLDTIERTLHQDDIIICDANDNPLCIAGVYGGLDSGVTDSTTTIFLESAYFDPVSIRKTAKRHQLNTDASFRFERGIDPNLVEIALKYATLLIQKIAGGKVTSEITDIYPNKIENHEILVSFENINKLIGNKISADTIKNILASLDIKIISQTKSKLGLIVPAYRVDVTREADIVEEILRIYGYNNIKTSEKVNTSIPYFEKYDANTLQNIIANQLTALGFYETMTNSLTKPNYIELANLNKEANVTMLNPLSNDLATMRQTMLFSGLEAIIYNINRKKNNLKLFEFGNTYHKFKDNYEEQKHITLLVTGNKTNDNWITTNQKSDFFYFKGIVTTVLERLGFNNLKITPIKNTAFSEGINFSKGKLKLVEFGLVNQKIIKKFGIKQEVLFADFDFNAILKIIKKDNFPVTNLPKYPVVKRDLALLIDEKCSFKEIYNIAFQTEQKLLKTVDLFDVYKGKNLPKGKKSYAVSFLLQDKNKTLEDKQIDKIMQKLQTTFTKQLGAELR
ncbi:MAG: phenylalanine--tRNA ligase subunit beta [Flavobacteriaceae bacterium]|nr:phenylalanine--tRNA ligase subunit beta [Flavobacteriaceae bacterium]